MINSYLSRENTDCFKGVCALMVVLSHVCSCTGVGASLGLGVVYTAFGYLAVSGFMFISGYGLMFSLSSKLNGVGYLHDFLGKRVLPIYLLTAILSLFYFVLKSLLGTSIPQWQNLMQSFVFGLTVIPFGWYLQSIVLLYLLFYVSAKISSNHRVKLCLMMTVALLFYIGLCLIMDLVSTWYETVWCFLAGMIVAKKKSNIDRLLNTRVNTLVVLGCVFLVFAISFILGNSPVLSHSYKIIFKMISSVLFVFSCIPMLRLIPIANPLTIFLSTHYLDIYICQGLVFLLLRNKYWMIDNNNVFFLVAVPLILIVAWIVKPLTSGIIRWAKNVKRVFFVI